MDDNIHRIPSIYGMRLSEYGALGLFWIVGEGEGGGVTRLKDTDCEISPHVWFPMHYGFSVFLQF